MPIYEYRCGACGFQKEYLQKVADATKNACPQCGSENFNKLLSAAGFQLKGSGWYATDFKNKPKVEKKDQSKPAAAAASDSEKKTAGECGGGARPASQ
jgi:putative FmdB family regulatory protein